MLLNVTPKRSGSALLLPPGRMAGPSRASGTGPRWFDGFPERVAPPGGNAPGASLVPLLLCLLFLLLIPGAPDRAVAQVPAAAPTAFRLVGTVTSTALSGAVLVDSTGLQSFYRLRERLPDDSQIMKVRSDSILLKRTDGMLYELFITQDVKSAAPAGPAPDVRPPVPAEEKREQGADEGKRRPHRRDRLRPPGQVP